LIAYGDQQRGGVLAVLGLAEGGARAGRLDTVGAEFDAHRERVGVGGSDRARRVGVVDLDVADRVVAEVLEPPHERPRAEEPTEAAIAEGRESV
jgi:hypothetical protein